MSLGCVCGEDNDGELKRGTMRYAFNICCVPVSKCFHVLVFIFYRCSSSMRCWVGCVSWMLCFPVSVAAFLHVFVLGCADRTNGNIYVNYVRA